MKNYICQFLLKSGTMLESNHDNFFKKLHTCIHISKKHYIVSSSIFANQSEDLIPIVAVRAFK